MQVVVDRLKLNKKAGEFSYTRSFGKIHERHHVPKPRKLRKTNKSKRILKNLGGSIYVKHSMS